MVNTFHCAKFFQFDSCRHLLLDSLYKLLNKVFLEDWVNDTLLPEKRSSQLSPSPFEANNTVIHHIQQTLLTILEDIIMSLKGMALLDVCFLIMKQEFHFDVKHLLTFSLVFLVLVFTSIKFHYC